MNVASGACLRAASSRFSVPLALTREVGLRVRRRPVVRGLRGGVDDQLEVAARAWRRARSTPSASRMSSSIVRNSSGNRSCEAPRSCGASRPRGRRSARACRSRCRPRRSRARRSGATDSEPIRPPEPVTMAVGIGVRIVYEAPQRHERRSCVARSSRADVRAGSSRGAAPRAPVGVREQPRAVGQVDADVARRGPCGRRRPAPSRPVSSRHSAVVSSSDRLHVAAAADVERRAVPVRRARELVARSGRPGRRRAAGRAPACRRRRSRCRPAAARSGGRASSA